MRILIVCPYYFPYTSGMTVYAQRLAEGLAKRGHQLKILTHNHNHLPEHEKINGVEIFRVPAMIKFGRGIFSPWMAEKFLKLMDWAEVVNIHAPFFECGLLARLAKKRGKKVFFTYHCDMILTGVLSPLLVDKLHKISINNAAKYSDAIIMNSLEYAKGSYVKNFLHKVMSITPPLDDKKFKRIKSNRFRRKYSIGKKDFIVGFLGRLTSEKGLKTLIYAAKFLEGKIERLKIIIVGEGVLVAGGRSESEMPKLKNLAETLGMQNIIFPGKIPDKELNDFFSSIDVFVLPSVNRLESFGMVQVEAMLCGTPAVVSDIPGVSKAIKKTGFGLLFEPNNPNALADKIFEIFKNKKKYIPVRKKIIKNFGIKNTLDTYEKLFMKGTTHK